MPPGHAEPLPPSPVLSAGFCHSSAFLLLPYARGCTRGWQEDLVFPAWMILLPWQASWNNLWHIPVCWGQRGKLHIFRLFVLFYLFKVRLSWYKTSIILLLFREAPGGELLHVCYLTGGLMTSIGGRQPSQFWVSHYHSGWGYFFICRVPLCQGIIPLILHIIAQVLHPSLPFWEAC